MLVVVTAASAAAQPELEDDGVAALARADEAYAARSFAEAERLYRSVLDRAPRHVHTIRRLCAIDAELGRREAAIRRCESALEIERSAENLRAMALVHAGFARPMTAGDAVRARALVAEALASSGDDRAAREAQFLVGAALADLAAVDEAYAVLSHGVRDDELAPLLARASILLIHDYAHRRRAIDYAEQALERAPNEPLAHVAMARVYSDNRPDLACLAMRRAHELAPDDVETTYLLAVMADAAHQADAGELIETARAQGLDDERYRAFVAERKERRIDPAPFLALGSILGVWLLSALVLFGGGALASRLVRGLASRVLRERSARSGGARALARFCSRVFLWLAVAWFFLTFLVLLLGAAAVVVGVFWMIAAGVGRIPWLGLIGLAVVLTVMSVLQAVVAMFRRERREPGERLDLAQHPRLGAMLADVARRAGARPVDVVYVTPDARLSIEDRGPLLRTLLGRGERALVIGLGAVTRLRRTELEALVAHEYGHFASGHAAGGSFALALLGALAHLEGRMVQKSTISRVNPAWWFVLVFHRAFAFIARGACAHRQVLADAGAAAAYGSRTTGGALRRWVDATVRDDVETQRVLQQVVAERRPLPNLYAFERAARPDDEETQAWIAGVVERLLDRPPAWLDSHPSLRERLAFIDGMAVEVETPPEDGRAADLLDERAALEERMTRRVCDALRARTGHHVAAA